MTTALVGCVPCTRVGATLTPPLRLAFGLTFDIPHSQFRIPRDRSITRSPPITPQVLSIEQVRCPRPVHARAPGGNGSREKTPKTKRTQLQNPNPLWYKDLGDRKVDNEAKRTRSYGIERKVCSLISARRDSLPLPGALGEQTTVAIASPPYFGALPTRTKTVLAWSGSMAKSGGRGGVAMTSQRRVARP